MQLITLTEVHPKPFSLLLALFTLIALPVSNAVAQQFGPVVRIPITKVRETYSSTNESGTSKSCGVHLFGEWPAYRNYTNRSSYRIFTPELARIPTPQNFVNPGERFRFYCFFNGISTGNFNDECPTKIGETLPDWYVELYRLGPTALFGWKSQPGNPALVAFNSVSTDPDLDPIASERWLFGDGTEGSGVGPIHRYAKPGNFPVRLTVTDSDGLTNAATITVTIPAPSLSVSLRIFSKHENNRIEPQEVFRVRATVAASSDGVGDLSNIVFTGPALVIPTNLTVLEVPVSTEIGTLQPGSEQTFEWVLRGAAIGDFVLQTSSLTAKDAIGRNVSANRATVLGSVTAFLAGIEQRPRRVVLGEDNNGDGVINAADARVELVLGITNVTDGPITELRTDNPGEPIGLVTRLADVPVNLSLANAFSGEIGTLLPGAANAVFRTNVYNANNYVYATASTLLRGKAGSLPVQAGASAAVEVRRPGVKITMHALEESGLDRTSIAPGSGNVDEPLVPAASAELLEGQREIAGGLVGDGVTPLLFILEADTKALTIQSEELRIRLVATVAPNGRLLGQSLQNRLRILKDGAWVQTDTAVMTRSSPKVFASLTPIGSDEIQPGEGLGRLEATLQVRNEETDILIEGFGFGLRKPPIALVHGYNTDGTWGGETLAALRFSRTPDARGGSFVRVIRYGQSVDTSDPVSWAAGASINTTWPLEDLVIPLYQELQDAMKPIKEHWALTRHDVVAHSQGGLLTRMLCSQNPNPFLVHPFRNKQNFYRGRFHRVVTIGSPHNGTRILRYMLTLDAEGSQPHGFIPELVSEWMVLTRVAQKKFDPWGPEIVQLNNQHPNAPWYPDPGARFHLVRTTVNNGQPPSLSSSTVADKALLLGPSIIPRGSDGVVDFDSMGASGPGETPGLNVFTLPSSLNVSHATTPLGPYDDIFGGTDGGQVKAPSVAKHVIGALDQSGVPDQHRVFGPFHPPRPLSFVIRDAIDEAARLQAQVSNQRELAVIDAREDLGQNRTARPAGEGVQTFVLDLAPIASRPVGPQGVLWFAELFGTNGVSIDGLKVTPDPSIPTRATLEIRDGVLGDVVAYALYSSSTGGTVYSRPLRVASFEPSSPAVELRVLPQGTKLPVGDTAPIQLMVRHADGLWIRRHVTSNEISVASREPTVVNVDNPLRWHCRSSGRSAVTVTWRGLTRVADVTVFGHSQGSLPVPQPLVWLRSDAGLELDGTNLVSWTDQSRNGFVFNTSTEVTRPAWVTNVINGLPAIRFTGANRDRLVANLGRTLTNATIFTVCRFEGNASSAYAYAFGTPDFSGLMMTLARRSGHGAYHYDGAAERVAPNTIAGSAFQIFSQVYGEGGHNRHRLAVNTRTLLETQTTVGRAYSAIATNVILGKYITSSSTGSMTGDIVEWIVYDRALDLEERLEVEEYLRRRYGLQPFFSPGSLDLADAETSTFESAGQTPPVWSPNLARRERTLAAAAAPSFLLIPSEEPGNEIHARLRSDGDRGFLGFVFGLRDEGNFLLLDWNRTATNHPTLGLAPAGLRLRSFHLPSGQKPTPADFWSSPDPARVTLLASTNTPWAPGVDYDLAVRALPGRLELQVRNGTNVLANWALPALGNGLGEFGFFANAAPGVRMGQVVLPNAPLLITDLEPASDTEATLRWINGRPPFVIEATTNLDGGRWFELAPATPNLSKRIPLDGSPLFLRVRGSVD